jgi:DNA-binding FrmR family transcriptional regulator
MPHDLTHDITTPAESIAGQISGIIRTLENDDDPDKILTQFKEAKNGLDKTHHLLSDELIVKCLLSKLRNGSMPAGQPSHIKDVPPAGSFAIPPPQIFGKPCRQITSVGCSFLAVLFIFRDVPANSPIGFNQCRITIQAYFLDCLMVRPLFSGSSLYVAFC